MFYRLFTSKKGQAIPDEILIIAQLLIVAIAGSIIFLFIEHWSSQTIFEKNWLSKDAGTFIGAIYAAPEDIWVNYSIVANHPYDFLVSFKDKIQLKEGEKDLTRIIVKKEEYDESEIWYSFARNSIKPDMIQEFLDLKNGIIISKIDNKLKIDKGIKNILELRCPTINTTYDPKKILIDAGHSGGEGFKKDDLIEGNIVGNMGGDLVSLLIFLDAPVIGLGPFKPISTRDGQRRMSDDKIKKQINEKKPSVIISLHTGNYNKNTNNVKAYYSIKSTGALENKSKKLACLILNEISELNKKYLKIDGTAIIPIYEEDYENALLPEGNVSILLEIGNIQSEEGQKTLKSGKIASAITRGIENYFK